MFPLVLDAGRWVFRLIGLFVAIIAILWVGRLVQVQLNGLADLEKTALYLKNSQSKLRSDMGVLGAQAEKAVASLTKASTATLDQSILTRIKKIEENTQKLREMDDILSKLNPAKHVDIARIKLEVEVDSQIVDYLRHIKNVGTKSNAVEKVAEECEQIRLKHVDIYNSYSAVDQTLASINASTSLNAQWNRFSQEYKSREELKSKRSEYVLTTHKLKADYEQCYARLLDARRDLNGIQKAKAFVFNNQRTQAISAELDEQIQAIQGELDQHWFRTILYDPLRQNIPIALGILAGVILVPPVIKSILYFLLAPLAARQSPICLRPDVDANYTNKRPADKSVVSLTLDISPGSELVVLPSYFHSAPEQCSISSRFLLNRKFVLTTLAAGMYNLTAVQSEQEFVVTLSSGQDSLAELLCFELGHEESVCLLPRNLVGIIQKRDVPVRISSHWRLFSLQAWLTLQLRYLVFHGPALIIIKGCRGVRVESVSGSRAIEQVSTVGFTANLNYTTSRTETFMAYLSGKKGLLRDRFSGPSGFIIYEEMPDPSKRSGITGRGIEGVTDAVLKVFGI